MARPVGSQNRLCAAAKLELAQAFFDLGGRTALVKFAGENPEAFYKIWAKLIPNDARIELAVSHTVTRNFTGKATELQAESLPVLDCEVSEDGVARVVQAIEETSHSVSCEVVEDGDDET